MTKVAYISFTTSDLSAQMQQVKSAIESIRLTPRITASSSAQTEPTVDVCYHDIDECDIFIGLVGHRLGWVPVHPSNQHGMSIVELEFNRARQAGKPCLMFLGDAGSVRGKDIDEDRTAINEYRERLLSGKECCLQHFCYDDLSQLGADVLAALHTQLEKEIATADAGPATILPATTLTEQQHQFKQKLVANALDTITDEEINAVYESLKTPTTVESWLLKRWTHWARRSPGTHTSAGELQNTFVNLQLQLQSDENRDLHPQLEMLESESNGERTVLYKQLAHALQLNINNRTLWVLLGPPGAGKTTVLQHYELSCIENALRAMAEGGEKKPEICIWIRLSTYKPAAGNDCPPPEQWLESQWNKIAPGLGLSIEELKLNFKLRFLLDGLNEIPEPVRDQATALWSDWAEDCRIAGQVLPMVFSVRRHEYSPRLQLPNDMPAEVHLRLWQPAQIDEYIEKQLGADNPLARQITADNKLTEFYGLPLNLYHLCELHSSPRLTRIIENDASTLLNHRGRLYIGMLWLRLQRLLQSTHQRQQLIESGLLTARLCVALEESQTQIYALRSLLEKCPLVAALKTQALTMQHSGTQVSVHESTVAPDLEPSAREALIIALEAMRVAEVENGDQFRFVHQQWQEFFAALALAERLPQTSKLPDFTDATVQSLERFDATFAGLTTSQPLPAAPLGRWAETARLLLELACEKKAWFTLMANGNYPLAAFAAEPVRDELPRDSLNTLRDALLEQMIDPEVDLRQRLLCGHVLPMVGDPRYQELKGPDKTRYLLPNDDHIIRIPAGNYTIGSLHGANDEHCNGQLHRVVLTDYRLSFAPVTNAEYACFVDAGGYDSDRWWLEPDSLAWRNGKLANTVSEKEERRGREEYLQLGAAEFQKKYSLTQHQLETSSSIFGMSDTEFESRLGRLYSAPGRAFTEPEQWRNPVFNLPAQPVVGVSWFEAAAYCQWLSVQSGTPIKLPSEVQWEVAARGIDGREYPWGNTEPGVFQINADAAHLRCTSPVGVFHAGETPTQLADMAGNVWEWCADWYGSYQASPVSNPRGPDGGRRVLRGGAWRNSGRLLRSAARSADAPGFRSRDIGFRLAQVHRPRSDS